ncbi:MAG: zinc-binding alcohol dehydrogenase [Myxococcota bacterium]
MTAGSIEARAFWVEAPGRGSLRPVTVPSPADGQVRIRALFSGVSRGTESLVFHGRVPPSEHERMRGPHQEGTLALPVKYGYALVGEIIDGPGQGDAVFCLHPHQSVACVTADAVRTLPDTVPPGRAVLAPNLETALNATWDGRVGAGDRVVVVGAGVVGCLTAYVCGRTPGCAVQLVDVDPRRSAVADRLGVSFATPEQAWSGADVVFHASATSAGLQTALDAAGTQARVVELSWYGDRETTVSLGTAFHPGRLQIVGSQVGTIPPDRAPRWTYARRMSVALELLADDALDALISGESAFADLPQTMARLAAPGSEHVEPVLCHRICY